jgi:hypothetical protein
MQYPDGFPPGHVVRKTKMALKGIASRVAAANARGGGNWINPGEGELVVLALKDGGKEEGFNEGATFVAEMKVERSTGFTGCKDAQGKEKPAGNPVGSVASYICQFDLFEETAFTNCKTFLIALMDETEESLAEAAIATAKLLADPAVPDAVKQQCTRIMKECNDATAWNADCEFARAYEMCVDQKANRMRGKKIKYSTYEKPNKAKTNVMTLIRWEPVKQTGAEIAAKRAELDASTPKASEPTPKAAPAA